MGMESTGGERWAMAEGDLRSTAGVTPCFSKVMEEMSMITLSNMSCKLCMGCKTCARRDAVGMV